MLNYILEIGKHCIGYTFGFCVMRFIFDSNIKNPLDVFLEQCKKLSNQDKIC